MKYYDINFVLELIAYFVRHPVNMRTLEGFVKVITQEVELQQRERDEEKSEKEADEAYESLNKSMTEKAIKQGIEEGIEKWKKEHKKK